MDPSDPWEGRTLNYEVFAMRLGYTFDAFPDIKFELQTAISEGDHVTTTWMMTCNNRGKNGAVSLTNKIIRTLGLTIYHFADDKICGHTQVVDRRTSMKKLGFLSESVDENLKGYAINTIITS